MSTSSPRKRARDLGLPFPGKPGPFNAITDVPGVEVGFCTLTDPAKHMRTGVTAIRPSVRVTATVTACSAVTWPRALPTNRSVETA